MKKLLFITFIFCSILISAQEQSQINNANKLYQDEKWEEAIVAFNMLTKVNSTKGDYLFKLATIHRKQKDYQLSIDSYTKSLNVGYKTGRCIYFIASNNAQLNNHSEALKWISIGLKTPKSIYYSDLITKKDFDNVRGIEAFDNLYPKTSDDASRQERWKTDIGFFKKVFETIHYNLFKKMNPDEWENDIKQIEDNISKLSDDAIIVKLSQLVAKVGDGHTFVRPILQGDLKFHFYPVQLYQFKEGVFVTAINEKYASVVGSKLTHIDGVPIAEIQERFKAILSVDNVMGYKENIYLTMLSEILFNLNITKHKTKADFTFETKTNEKIIMTIDALDFNPALWNSKVEQIDAQLPLYRSNPNDYFWYKHLPEQDAVYLQLNINFSMPDKDIDEFYDDVFTFINDNNIKHLILDIRNCPGGNSFNNKSLIEHIIKTKSLQKKGSLYTIIGRKTFSAAMNLATDLEQWTNTIFIGEPTGSSPNFIGETNFVELPYSKLNISISNAYWQRSVSWDKRHWIAPDIFIEPSFKDYISNNDAVLNYIFKKLN